MVLGSLVQRIGFSQNNVLSKRRLLIVIITIGIDCICERECMDFKRHLQVSHKLTEEQYREEFCGGQDPQV